MTITLVSVVVAIVIGSIEALGLISDKLKLQGPAWDAIGALNDNLGTLGYLIIGIAISSLR
jgi:high-affinity nickel-transport protein